MKIVRLRLIFLLVLLLPVVDGIAAPPSPPPPTPPPPPGLPIDSGLAVLMMAAVLYGAFEIYRYNIKKTR